jgi:hypothetical protein
MWHMDSPIANKRMAGETSVSVSVSVSEYIGGEVDYGGAKGMH